MKRIPTFLVLLGVLLLPLRLRADTIFTATLNGAQEGNASTATGFGTVVLNTLQTMITVNESWTGLSALASATHIQCCVPPGSGGPVVFALLGFPNATSGSIPEQTFAISPNQVAGLLAGLAYFDVHDAVYAGGEIRGQILPAAVATPEPGSLALMLSGVGIAFALRKRLLVQSS